ncbi:hypothetical protein GLOTRDRAFT_139535 [Gloeophyllum trabeum ATCC 11539]|uniref:Glycosyltransferase family 49 protein n=1 Tax=Gloeophyllum trabeum (strain ATCC 11539 / FP-39264 / Madison 617) TaxID=670483 RepID=S7Q3M0_GLOTA|nr:uncharacterized protein GLOTRDRAFT_139535 [Gloeophyllum trabeum ATCC 11539]EPQ54157.1 hypothetical protein GLOTRDRAFT_139535 [Gloeophyllum trabeum ATCC 11539]
MHPSKIIPYFYRATASLEQDDITIATLVTSNRFEVFKKLVVSYKGPVSVAIHIKDSTEEIEALLDRLHELYTSDPLMSLYVDVHLVVDRFDRQFNTWRNIARLFARTDFVMMLDVDFAVCTDFRSSIRRSRAIMDKLEAGNTALVVPAFEYVKQRDGMDQSKFPKSKKELVSLVRQGLVDIFHRSWAPGHNSTDYDRFYVAQPGEVYKVTQYQSAYEPYVIFKKEGPPWYQCDERFVGYGGNKAACIYEMYLSGISFYVLSDHFLIHQSHPYEEQARKNERKYNKKIYSDFKEEACLRYLKRFYADGTLNTTRGHNVQEECRKIKGFSRIAAQVEVHLSWGYPA